MEAHRTTARTTRRTLAAAAIGFAGLLAAGGCANKVTLTELRLNPSPNYATVGETYTEALNDLAIELNSAVRLINEDARRTWLLDKPSNLSPTLKTRSP